MNLLHMKYAVEIAETNSLNKAAEHLYVGQSALSRAVKELEANLGVTLFERSAKGMTLTPDGETFVGYARGVLKQVDNIENVFKKEKNVKRKFSLSAPRSTYICEAFTAFSGFLSTLDGVEAFYNETNSMQTVKNVLQDDYRLGIVRYAEEFDRYYKSMLDEKGLTYEFISEFSYVLLVGEKSELAGRASVSAEELKGKTEITHADPYVPSLPFADVKKEALSENTWKKIYVFERASQFEILTENPDTFMWVSPVPKKVLERYGLHQLSCDGKSRVYKDVLIHRRDYSLSELDKKFIEILVAEKRNLLRGGQQNEL